MTILPKGGRKLKNFWGDLEKARDAEIERLRDNWRKARAAGQHTYAEHLWSEYVRQLNKRVDRAKDDV